jgi:fumarate hydratase, class II
VIADAMLQSIRLLADASLSFSKNCVEGLEANKDQLVALTGRSLMLVTALAPVVGYDAAAKIAKEAHRNGTTLRHEAIRLNLVDEATFDRVVDAAKMIRPHHRDAH